MSLENVWEMSLRYISASQIVVRGPQMARGALKMARERLMANVKVSNLQKVAVFYIYLLIVLTPYCSYPPHMCGGHMCVRV